MTAQIRQFELPLLLLTTSVPKLFPSMSLRKSQEDLAVVSVKVDGRAFPNTKNKLTNVPSSATLTLCGSVHVKRDGGLKLDDLAGSLEIGLANYTITSGTGQVSKKGKIEISARTGDSNRKLELILHGSTEGDTVAFDRKASRLSSLYFLSLEGEATVAMPATAV